MEPELGSFLWMRFAKIIQFMLSLLPIALLIVKVMEWSGNYVPLVFLCATGIVKFILLYIYPKLIMPLESSVEDIPDYAQRLLPFIQKEAKAISFDPNSIKLEKSF